MLREGTIFNASRDIRPNENSIKFAHFEKLLN